MPSNAFSRRRFLQLMAGASAAVLAGACAPTAAPPTPTSAPQPTAAATETPTPAPTKQPITISMICDPDPPAIYEEISKAAAEFKDANPHITIQIEPRNVPSGEEVVPWLAAGTAPDTFRWAINQAVILGAKGLLHDLAPLAEEKGIADKYIEAVWKAYMWRKGEVFSLPNDVNTLALWCNPVLFEQAGVKDLLPPKNWDEMLTVAKAVAKPDEDPEKAIYAYAFPTTIEWSWFFFWFWLWREGGDFYDGENLIFNSPEAVEAIKKIKFLIDQKYLPAFDNWQDPWYDGRCAMQEYGSWAIHGDIPGPWNDNNPPGKWTADYERPEFVVAPMIQLKEDVPNYSVFAGFSWFLPKTNKYPSETVDWLWFMISHPTYGTLYLRHGRQLLCTKVVTHPWLEHPAWAAFMKQLETTKPLLSDPESYSALEECLPARLIKAWLGEAPIEQMLQEAYDCAKPLVEEAKKALRSQ
jgi:ABC-type glycerol-3-phosphate transport system substrate-binding protein